MNKITCVILIVLIGGVAFAYKKYMPDTNQQSNTSEHVNDIFPKPIVNNGITYSLVGKEEITRDYLLDGTEETQTTGYTINLIAADAKGNTKWSTQVFWSQMSSPEFLKTVITEFVLEGEHIKISGPMVSQSINIDTGEIINK